LLAGQIGYYCTIFKKPGNIYTLNRKTLGFAKVEKQNLKTKNRCINYYAKEELN